MILSGREGVVNHYKLFTNNERECVGGFSLAFHWTSRAAICLRAAASFGGLQ